MKRSLFLFILLLHIWICNADNYYCKTIGLENGLSQSSVTGVAYDENGSLWVGTRFGLNEYRNGELRTFYDEHPAFCATESGDSLYFGGHDGIAVFNYGDGTLTPLKYRHKFSELS